MTDFTEIYPVAGSAVEEPVEKKRPAPAGQKGPHPGKRPRP